MKNKLVTAGIFGLLLTQTVFANPVHSQPPVETVRARCNLVGEDKQYLLALNITNLKPVDNSTIVEGIGLVQKWNPKNQTYEFLDQKKPTAQFYSEASKIMNKGLDQIDYSDIYVHWNNAPKNPKFTPESHCYVTYDILIFNYGQQTLKVKKGYIKNNKIAPSKCLEPQPQPEIIKPMNCSKFGSH